MGAGRQRQRPALRRPPAALEAYRAPGWKAAGALAHVDAISPIDEPNLDYRDKAPASWPPWRSSATCSPACACAASTPATARRAARNCLTIGADSYQGGDNVLLQGRRDQQLRHQLLPHQGLILVPGGADTRYRQPTPSEWVSYAQCTWPSAAAWSCARFAWRTPADQPVLKGICDQPALRAAYEAAFKGKA